MTKLKKHAVFCAALLTAIFALNSCNKVEMGVSSIDPPISYETPTESEEFSEELSFSTETSTSEEALPLSVTVGATTVNLSDNGAECVFTADETAVYTLSVNDGNGLIFWTTLSDSGCVSIEESDGSISLQAGETLTLLIVANDGQTNSLSFLLTKNTAELPPLLCVGNNELSISKADGEAGASYLFSAPADGYYAVNSWMVGGLLIEQDFAIIYTLNGESKTLDGKYTLLSLQKDETVSFAVYAYENAFEEEDSYSVDLNIHTVAVTNEPKTVTLQDNSAPLVFYAAEAGRYSITVSTGATVMQYSTEVWELVAIVSFDAQANSLIELTVFSKTLTEATVTIVKL